MCAFDELHSALPSSNSAVREFDINFSEPEKQLFSSTSVKSSKVSSLEVSTPPSCFLVDMDPTLTPPIPPLSPILLSSQQTSSETDRAPPAYDSCTLLTAEPATRTKANLFSRLFSRSHKKRSIKQELPSYREAELVEAWAKVGIDINDRKQGPRPKCTPEELLGAMDGLFGAPTLPEATSEYTQQQRAVRSDLNFRRA